jgi:hypothetical protein
LRREQQLEQPDDGQGNDGLDGIGSRDPAAGNPRCAARRPRRPWRGAVAGDLPGFVPRGFLAPSTSAQSEVAESPPERRASEAARLKALGFIAGISERLMPETPISVNEEAISLVEQFRSAHGANGEVAAQLKQALARGETAFAVPGIPGARGFGSSTASPPDANVAFPVGAYYYLVGFGSSAPTRSQLITAVQRLYRRVRG